MTTSSESRTLIDDFTDEELQAMDHSDDPRILAGVPSAERKEEAPAMTTVPECRECGGSGFIYTCDKPDVCGCDLCRADCPSCRDKKTPAMSNVQAEKVAELADALRSYEQYDEDGVIVLASRQACDEAASLLTKLQAERDEASEALREIASLLGLVPEKSSHQDVVKAAERVAGDLTEVTLRAGALQAERDDATNNNMRLLKAVSEEAHARGAAEARAEALQAEVNSLKSRLEIVQDGWPDGIATRDETIRQQDALISGLKAEKERVQSIVDSTSLGAAMDTEYRLRIAAEAQVTTLRARISELEKALEPFAGDKMPSLKRSAVDYDRNGLRRLISPMEIAMRDARATKGGEK